MTAGGAGGFGDGVAVGVGHVARSDGALHGLRGLLDVHERGIHQERRDARMDEVGQGLGHIELNTVEQVTAAERVGAHAFLTENGCERYFKYNKDLLLDHRKAALQQELSAEQRRHGGV